MLIAIVRIPAPPTPEGAAELERRFAERLPMVAGAAGFLGFELLRPAEGGGEYLSISRWAGREEFEAWRNSTYNAQAHGHQAPAAHGTAGASPSRPAAHGGGATLYELCEL